MAGECVAQGNGSKEHFNADDEVLVASSHCPSSHLLPIDDLNFRDHPTFLQDCQQCPCVGEGRGISSAPAPLIQVGLWEEKHRVSLVGPTLPEGEEDDGLDGDELEDWLKRAQQVHGGEVEEEKGIKGQAD